MSPTRLAQAMRRCPDSNTFEHHYWFRCDCLTEYTIDEVLESGVYNGGKLMFRCPCREDSTSYSHNDVTILLNSRAKYKKEKENERNSGIMIPAFSQTHEAIQLRENNWSDFYPTDYCCQQKVKLVEKKNVTLESECNWKYYEFNQSHHGSI